MNASEHADGEHVLDLPDDVVAEYQRTGSWDGILRTLSEQFVICCRKMTEFVSARNLQKRAWQLTTWNDNHKKQKQEYDDLHRDVLTRTEERISHQQQHAMSDKDYEKMCENLKTKEAQMNRTKNLFNSEHKKYEVDRSTLQVMKEKKDYQEQQLVDLKNYIEKLNKGEIRVQPTISRINRDVAIRSDVRFEENVVAAKSYESFSASEQQPLAKKQRVVKEYFVVIGKKGFVTTSLHEGWIKIVYDYIEKVYADIFSMDDIVKHFVNHCSDTDAETSVRQALYSLVEQGYLSRLKDD